jgi:hypothetical protein
VEEKPNNENSKEPQERLVIEVTATAVFEDCEIWVRSPLRKISFELLEKTPVRYSTHNLTRDCSEVPLLCKEGLGEVEAWSGNMWVPPALIAICTTLPHLNPPLTKGRKLVERNFRKNGEPISMLNPEAPFVILMPEVEA